MGNQDQGGCFVVLGILMIVAGWFWWWPLFIMGILFLFLGICFSSKSKQRAYQQAAAPTFTQQIAPQQPTQQVTQPTPVAPQVPEKAPAIARYCPDCGAPTEEKFCTLCGKEID